MKAARLGLPQFAVLLAIAAVLLLVGWASGLVPLEGQVCDNEQAQTEECASYYLPFAFWWNLTKFFEASGDTFVALGTIAIACFTYTLWRSTHRLWEAGEAQRISNENIARAQRRQFETASMNERFRSQHSLAIASRSADAATEAAAAARDTFIATHRTWLTIRPLEIGPASFDGGQVKVRLVLQIENIGETPAFAVHVSCQAYGAKGTVVTNPVMEQFIAGEKMRWDSDKYGVIMMRRETGQYNFDLIAQKHPVLDATAEADIALGRSPPFTLSAAYCVIYKSMTSDVWHHTGQIVWIFRHNSVEFDVEIGTVSQPAMGFTVLPNGSVI